MQTRRRKAWTVAAVVLGAAALIGVGAAFRLSERSPAVANAVSVALLDASDVKMPYLPDQSGSNELPGAFGGLSHDGLQVGYQRVFSDRKTVLTTWAVQYTRQTSADRAYSRLAADLLCGKTVELALAVYDRACAEGQDLGSVDALPGAKVILQPSGPLIHDGPVTLVVWSKGRVINSLGFYGCCEMTKDRLIALAQIQDQRIGARRLN